jgi:hypothetical protein
MSKITKNDLKGIVKECLIEILAEGLISSSSRLSEGSQKRNSRKQELKSEIMRRPALDTISYAKNQQPAAIEKRPAPRINTSISDDPILNEIFADTAASTLQEQLAAENRKGHTAANVSVQGDQAAKIVAASNPEDLFGESASRWSRLAFSDQK